VPIFNGLDFGLASAEDCRQTTAVVSLVSQAPEMDSRCAESGGQSGVARYVGEPEVAALRRVR
jgi:hypothetical protein